MIGLNSVKMSGNVVNPRFTITANGYPKFSGRISIPITYKRGEETINAEAFHNIIAWGPVAEGFNDMIETLASMPIEISGTLNTRSYQGKCKHCSGEDKKYWTEVQVNNFIILEQ